MWSFCWTCGRGCQILITVSEHILSLHCWPCVPSYVDTCDHYVDHSNIRPCNCIPSLPLARFWQWVTQRGMFSCRANTCNSASVIQHWAYRCFQWVHRCAVCLILPAAGRWQCMLHLMPHHQYPNEVLLCHGYLGLAPIYPTVAILICALALFHQVHHACPRYSIQSFCKTLCYIHQVWMYRYESITSTNHYILGTILHISYHPAECCLWYLLGDPPQRWPPAQEGSGTRYAWLVTTEFMPCMSLQTERWTSPWFSVAGVHWWQQ